MSPYDPAREGNQLEQLKRSIGFKGDCLLSALR